MSATNVTTDTFTDEVLTASTPVLVDFWAEWCGPCKQMAPILDEIATDHAERLKVAKLDVDENAELATAYGISSIPTMLVFKGGQVVQTIVGARAKSALTDELATYL